MAESPLRKRHHNAETPPERRGLAAVCKPRWFTTACIFFLPPSGSDLVRGPRPIPFYLTYVKLNITAYITNAKFSNSCCNTGSEHPDISTRPTASRAACGDTP